MRFAIAAIALGTFAMGTTEFVVIGLLPTIGSDLAVDVPTAGLLVTGYAVGIAVGGTLIGVPLGTFIGQHSSWRVPFLIVAALAVVAAAAVRLLVRPRAESTVSRAAIAANRRALAFALLTTVVGFGSQFVLFTSGADHGHRPWRDQPSASRVRCR